jgi:hypothetical protein
MSRPTYVQKASMRLELALISFLLVLPTVAGSQQPMFPPTISPFADQTTWLLTRPFRYQILDTNLVIDVPVGFVTDFASIPRPLWALASPHGFYSRASIIHDFLYWDQRCTREQADRIMLIAMQESAVGFAERQAIYAGVRAGGQSSWDGNASARAQGMLRTVPTQFIDQVQPLDTWPDFRARLMKQGVREAPRPIGPPPTYCAAGN